MVLEYRAGALIQFKNCKILRNHAIITTEDLWVRNGLIINPEPVYFDERSIASTVVDCEGHLIAPGFIDVQINGAFGVDFSYDVQNVESGVKKVAEGLLAHGVTSFCPTVITSPTSVYQQVLSRIHKQPGSSSGAGVLGVHVEGPFISHDKHGAHPEDLIRSFTKGFRDVEDVYGTLDNVCLVTLAPELPSASSVIKEFVKKGITVSLGHSVGSLSQGEAAVQSGASFITHLFNAMLPFHHRDPGLVGLLTSDAIPERTRVYYGIIADGIHTHPAALRIAHRTHPKGLVLVTDAVPMMGFPPGRHHIGQQLVEIKDNKALIAGTNTLCGSIATMNQCVQHFLEATGCSKVEALEAASLHPAESLGIEHHKGTLDFGSDADFVILDDQLNVLSTYIGGECVWESPDRPKLKITISKEL